MKQPDPNLLSNRPASRAVGFGVAYFRQKAKLCFMSQRLFVISSWGMDQETSFLSNLQMSNADIGFLTMFLRPVSRIGFEENKLWLEISCV